MSQLAKKIDTPVNMVGTSACHIQFFQLVYLFVSMCRIYPFKTCNIIIFKNLCRVWLLRDTGICQLNTTTDDIAYGVQNNADIGYRLALTLIQDSAVLMNFRFILCCSRCCSCHHRSLATPSLLCHSDVSDITVIISLPKMVTLNAVHT